MLFNIPDIAGPIFITPRRLKWHLQFRARRTWRGLDPIEMAVRRQDTSTGGGTHLNSHAQERGMDAILAQQGALLEFANLVSHRQRHLAWPLSRLGLLL